MEGTAYAKAQKRDDKGSCWGAVESWSERLLRFSNGVFESPPLGILICNNAEQGILEQGRYPQSSWGRQIWPCGQDSLERCLGSFPLTEQQKGVAHRRVGLVDPEAEGILGC